MWTYDREIQLKLWGEWVAEIRDGMDLVGVVFVREPAWFKRADLITAAPKMFAALLPLAERCGQIQAGGDNPTRVLVPFAWLLEAQAAVVKAKGE